MAAVMSISEDSSTSLPDNLKSCVAPDYQNEGSLSPARPGESPDLPEDRTTSTKTFMDHSTTNGVENGSLGEEEEEGGGLLVTAEMRKEEEALEKANLKEEQRLRKEIEESRQEKELQEQRYKRLMHLLNKSEFYSQFLLQQIESQKAVMKVRRKNTSRAAVTSSQDKSSSQSDSGSSEATPGKGTKRKRSTRNSRNVRKQSYKITDVIDSDTVRAKATETREEEETEEIERVEQPRLFVNGVMRPYQLDGFSWLLALFENGVNGILGDEMGLGKTIQTIALMCHLVDQGVPGPFLVVGPLSTLPNWMSEFQRFAPQIPVLLYHGNETVRAERRAKMQARVKIDSVKNSIFPVVITSYEVAVRDTKLLNQFQWRYICVDEGHRLKNYKCQLAKCLNTYQSSNRLLLTGTPLQNNLAELWALLNFLMPDIFDSLDVFEAWFDVEEMTGEGNNEKILQQEREKQVITTLMKILSPFFLRRVKREVDLDIPPKREVLVYTPMTPIQVDLYQATLTYNINHFRALKNPDIDKLEYDNKGRPKRRAKRESIGAALLDDTDSVAALERFIEAIRTAHEKEEEKPGQKTQRRSAVRANLNNRMMQCRKVVNHPYLVDFPLNSDGTCRVDNDLLKVSGKLQVLDQLLVELHRKGHRVLLFSQMTMLLDILEDYLTLRPQFQYRRLDGSRSLEDRQADIKDFNAKSSPYFLFLLSTRAGGLGINLTSADTVIIYDSDWNPQADLQAQDRCHRIGQTSPVLVLRLITAATIDERVVERAAAKRKLEKLIIRSGKFNQAKQSDRSFEKNIDEEELINLLQERDHDRIHRTTTGNVFTQEELDRLLDRSDLMKGGGGGKKAKEVQGVFKVIEDEEEE